VLEILPRGARVLIVRLRSLGDCVLTTPAIELLHQYRPDLHLAVMADSSFEAVYRGNPAVRAILPPSARAALLFHPKLTINLHGGTRSMKITAASLARWRAGFGHYRSQWLYNLRMPRAQEVLGEERPVHTAEHVAAAMFWLGVPKAEIPRAKLYPSAPVPNKPAYALIHPFASEPAKTWPAANFVAVAKELSKQGLEPVFLGSAKDEFRPFAEYHTLRGATLEQIKNQLAGTSLFIGNDSGPAHMAAAFGVRLAVIFGPSDVNAWSPWRTRAEVLRGGSDAANVGVGQVLAAIESLQKAGLQKARIIT
jgi:heptosyltransferase III